MTEKKITEEDAQERWKKLNAEEKITVIANNAMSRNEAYERFESCLQKIETIALKLENMELKLGLKKADDKAE